MTGRRFEGRSASPGLAIGPLIRIDPDHHQARRQARSPADERQALDQAIARATADLEALAAVASGDGAAILAFQIDCLGDPALIETVLPLIENGNNAALAWKTSLDAEIEGYKTSGDDYFSARASDLDDLKDRVLRALDAVSSAVPDLPRGAIVIARDLPPSRFLELDPSALQGIVLTEGNASSHVAMLARARGLPMIVGLAQSIDDVVGTLPVDGSVPCDGPGPCEGILNADEGYLLTTPEAAVRKQYEAARQHMLQLASEAASLRDRPAVTADGQAVSILVTIDDSAIVDDAILAAADGVGLLRTEFLLMGRRDFPGEEEQVRLYADLQRRLDGKPLTIRTLDIGGDKPLPGLRFEREQNPFLGLRGIRFCLEHRDLFEPQIRALLRVAASGPLKVMLPMVTIQAEIDEAKHLFADGLKKLEAAGIDAAMPEIGIMIETPAAALTVDELNAAFFSIGSNDLIQHTMAASRDGSKRVASLLDPTHPAIERLIGDVVGHGQTSARDVSLCGDMASDPACLPLVLRAGVRKISVLPAAFDRVRAAIRTIDLSS